MKKLSLLITALAIVASASAQIDGFFPQFGQDSQWTVNDNYELVFSGDVAPAPAAGIATTFEGLVSDGIGGNDFTGLDISFDGIIIDAGTSTKIWIAYNGTWGEKAVNLEFNQWLCQAGTDYAFDGDITKRAMVTNFGAYQAAVKKNDYNKFEINVSATGLISCKLNGYVCDQPYQASLASLKPTGVNTFYVFFGNDISGFKMKNLVATKGGTTNSYFYNPESGIDKVAQASVAVYPNPTKGLATITSNFTGRNYHVTNMLGQTVQKGIVSNTNQQLNLSAEKAGTYMLVIDGPTGKVVKSIIKN